MKRISFGCAFAVAICAAVQVSGQDEGGWIDLFDGKSLKGWESKDGKARYAAVDGSIVGHSVPNTGNSFLCTKREFENFILEFEFMGHPKLNSGVQIRSQSLSEYRNGRVHGYQIELEEDDRERDWSGGIYDESRRGWLYPGQGDEELEKRFGEQGRRLWKDGEWNRIRVEARGDTIRTWLNGELRAELKDDMTAKGFIALQVHGVGSNEEPMSVRWRKIRIKELD